MEILEQVKDKLRYLGSSNAGIIIAHAAWSACDHRGLPGPSILNTSYRLKEENRKLVQQLLIITSMQDYSNNDQAEMLNWLHENNYSQLIAKRIKTTKKKLIDCL